MTAEAESSFSFEREGLELITLTGLVLVLAVEILVWRYSNSSPDLADTARPVASRSAADEQGQPRR